MRLDSPLVLGPSSLVLGLFLVVGPWRLLDLRAPEPR